MALTTDELRTRESAKLESLIADLMAAVRSDNTTALDDALANMRNFSERTPFPDLQLEASTARNAASVDVAKVALEELAKISDRASAAGASFKAAAMIAENGKKELLFPSLAATAARGLELLKQFEEAIDSVSATVGGVDELGDVPDAVDGLIAAFKRLKETVKAADSVSTSRSARSAPPRAAASRGGPPTRARKKTTKKKASRKKAAAKKKSTRKKAATKKKSTRKKAATKKKSTRKKAATKKKVIRKKAAVKKRTSKKKAVVKKKTSKKAAKKASNRKKNKRRQKKKAGA